MKYQIDPSKTTLTLTGKTAVFIDWANVYGWTNTLKTEINPRSLFQYLKKYSEIKTLNFYFGTDQHPKAKTFLSRIRKIGFTLITKPVKYITVNQKPLIKKRKCDFDIEITMDVFDCLENNYQSYVFISGDGDFAPLYQRLIKLNKQVIVIYAPKHIGREVWDIKKGLFKVKIYHLLPLKKSSPRRSGGRD